MSYSDELNNRVHFKLNAARRHLDNLIRLESDAGTLVASNVRVEAEQRIDEFLYHLIGVKDALLQEVNTIKSRYTVKKSHDRHIEPRTR
jgi:hypothetical protein